MDQRKLLEQLTAVDHEGHLIHPTEELSIADFLRESLDDIGTEHSPTNTYPSFEVTATIPCPSESRSTVLPGLESNQRDVSEKELDELLASILAGIPPALEGERSTPIASIPASTESVQPITHRLIVPDTGTPLIPVATPESHPELDSHRVQEKPLKNQRAHHPYSRRGSATTLVSATVMFPTFYLKLVVSLEQAQQADLADLAIAHSLEACQQQVLLSW